MQIRSRRLAAISGAALLVGSLMASGAPAVMAQDDYVPPCELPPGQDGQFKVGIAIREMVNDVDRDIVNGATAAIEAAGGVVTVTDAGGDARKQNENVENLMNAGVDGLFVVLGDAQQMSPLTQKAADKGIHVSSALFGATPDGALTDVGWDDPLASSLMTRALLSSIGYKGDVYVFWVPGAPILETRKRVLEAIAVDFPQVNLKEVPTEHGAAKSLAQMTDLLNANSEPGSIAGVWGAYDLLVSGANEAIRRAGRDEIKVASIDGDQVAFQMLYGEGSPFVSTVVGDVLGIGTLGGEAIIKSACGRADEVPISTYTQMWTATRNNGIAAGEARWGEGLWDAIQIPKEDIEAMYEQNQDVVQVIPILPQ